MTEQTKAVEVGLTPIDLLGQQIDGMLEKSMEQYESLRSGEPANPLRDDYNVGRVLARFTVQRDELWRFDEQLRRWEAGELTDVEREELTRLRGQMLRLNEVVDDILRLAAALESGTKQQQSLQGDTSAGGASHTLSTRRKRSPRPPTGMGT